MSTLQKGLSCERFFEEYKTITDTKKNNFSRICNKLLSENFIYGSIESDRNDYYDILEMKKMIEDYFAIIDFELIHVDTYKLFYIQTTADRNRLRLKKIDTVICLVLRLLYYKGTHKVNSNSDIQFKLIDLITEVNQTGIYKTLSNSEYMNALRLFKRYKIIDFSFKEFKEDNIITIYPTILYVVKSETVELLNERMKSFISVKEDEEDETEED